VSAFSDSNLASDRDTGRSTSGAMVKIGDCHVYWSSRWQGTVSTSTHWAELRACSDAIEQIQFVRSFLQEIGFGQDELNPVFVDNRSDVFTGSQSSHRIRGQEHIVRLTHFIAEAVQFQEVTLNHVPTIDNEPTFLRRACLLTVFLLYGLVSMYQQCWLRPALGWEC